ncbi:MAG: hemolysin III family protein [Bacilli bacterium]
MHNKKAFGFERDVINDERCDKLSLNDEKKSLNKKKEILSVKIAHLRFKKQKEELKKERKAINQEADLNIKERKEYYSSLPENEKEVSAETVKPKKNKLTPEEDAYLRKVNRLPRYTHGEEIFNSVTHMVGGGFGVIFLVVGVVCAVFFSPTNTKAVNIISMAIFGFCCIFLYTMSAIYHALHINKAKKVFQVIDHCTVYVLIAGSYVPVCLMELTAIAPYNYVLLGGIVALAALGIALNGTMMDKWPVKVVSNIFYIALGWTIVCFYSYLVNSLTLQGTWLFIGGGIAYTIGAILYAIGRNVKYFHSIFHLFVNLATLLQFLAILLYGIVFPAIA